MPKNTLFGVAVKVTRAARQSKVSPMSLASLPLRPDPASSLHFTSRLFLKGLAPYKQLLD